MFLGPRETSRFGHVNALVALLEKGTKLFVASTLLHEGTSTGDLNVRPVEGLVEFGCGHFRAGDQIGTSPIGRISFDNAQKCGTGNVYKVVWTL